MFLENSGNAFALFEKNYLVFEPLRYLDPEKELRDVQLFHRVASQDLHSVFPYRNRPLLSSRIKLAVRFKLFLSSGRANRLFGHLVGKSSSFFQQKEGTENGGW